MGIFTKWFKKQQKIDNSNEVDNSNENTTIETVLGLYEEEKFSISCEVEFYRLIDEYDKDNTKFDSLLCDVTKESGLLDRKDIVLEAVKRRGMDLKYASDELRKDIEVIETAFKNNNDSIKYAKGISLKIALRICDNVPLFVKVSSYFPYIIDDLEKDEENRVLLLNMIKLNPSLIERLTKYQNDLEFINVSLEKSPTYIRYAGKDISDEMILSELKRYYKMILENMRSYAKNNDSVLKVWNKYRDNLMVLLDVVSEIKERYPTRFDNENFVLQLFYINPILIKTANPRYINDPFIMEMYQNYQEETPYEVYNRFASKK